MPNIREYNLPPEQATLRPSELGVQAFEQAGQHEAQAAWRISEFGRETGQSIGGGIAALGKPVQDFMNNHQAATEISTSQNLENTVKLQLMHDINNKIKQNPNLDVNGWIGDMQRQVDAQGGAFQSDKGRETWRNASGSLKNYLTNYAIQQGSLAAGKQTVDNLDQSLNLASAAIKLDPSDMGIQSQLDSWKTHVQAQIDARNDILGANREQAMELVPKGQKQIVHDAMIGRIDANPEAFLRSMDDGTLQKWDQYITGPERELLKTHATSVLREQTAAQVKQNEDQLEQAKLNIVKDGLTKNANGDFVVAPGTVDKIQDLANKFAGKPGVKLSSVTELLTAIDTINKDGLSPKVWPETREVVHGLTERASIPMSDKEHLTYQQIDYARNHHMINNETYSALRQTLEDNEKNPELAASMHEFDKFVKVNIEEPFSKMGPGGTPSQLGAQAADDLIRVLRQEYQNRIGTGQSTSSDLLKMGGPLVTEDLIKRFTPSQADILKAQAETMAGHVPIRQSEEVVRAIKENDMAALAQEVMRLRSSRGAPGNTNYAKDTDKDLLDIITKGK